MRPHGQGCGGGKHRSARHVKIGIENENDRFALGGFGEIAVHRCNSRDARAPPGQDVSDFVADMDDAGADSASQAAEILSVAQNGLHWHAERSLRRKRPGTASR